MGRTPREKEEGQEWPSQICLTFIEESHLAGANYELGRILEEESVDD